MGGGGLEGAPGSGVSGRTTNNRSLGVRKGEGGDSTGGREGGRGLMGFPYPPSEIVTAHHSKTRSWLTSLAQEVWEAVAFAS